MSQAPLRTPEPTPVDDVRRVRARLSKEAGGDMRRLAEQSEEFFEQNKHKYNFRLVPTPPPLPGLAVSDSK